MNGLNLSWPANPGALIVIIALCLLFGLAILQAWRSSARDKPLTIWQVVAFVVAIIAMILVLLTPVDTIARTQLFLMHMAQAVVLTTLCAPLLLLAYPAWFLQPFLEHPV